MFERRVKFLLIALLLGVGLLALRAFQLQVVQHSDWTDQARASMRRQQLVDTVRGSIYDVKGRQIALDVACIDACVDYRVIQDPPDEKWVTDEARRRLRVTSDSGKVLTRAERKARLDDEKKAVLADIETMWSLLGRLPGTTPDKVAEAKRGVIQKVENRRRFVWYRSYEAAMKRHEAEPKPAWYRQWIAGSNAGVPKLSDFEIEVGEQLESHPILRNINAETNNFLAKNLDRLPGLVLKPGIARSYPYGEAGAHLMGHLTRVSREDLVADDTDDELRRYLPSDLIGRTGLEGLFESRLRGRRGRLVRLAGQQPTEDSASVPGEDVRTTIDIALQARVQELFAHARWADTTGSGKGYEVSPAHGAAVVLDLATNEVRALASYPAYDPNNFDIEALLRDEINLPMINRATMSMLEPGSTVKPMVGLSAITQGLIRVDEAIPCHGYLVINGKQYSVGRCWTMTQFKTTHEHIPYADPHPTGNLSYVDAVQRSCNVYFENCGDRLGIAGLTTWMDRFGLGRPTGVGVAEADGLTPGKAKIPSYAIKSTSWFSGIGQSKVAATPIQMANVAATIARDGVWMRPRLVPTGTPLPPALAADGIPDRVDLHLDPAGLRAARLGMVRVVNTEAGSAKDLKRDDVLIAGKTGTAQAAPFTYRKRDANGDLVKDATGRVLREELQLSTKANPNPAAPWYRGTGKSGTDRAHSWFIGFAPAENPKIAFCVLVEYGGAGGRNAAPIARDILQACIDADYLEGRKSTDPKPDPKSRTATR